MTSKILCAVSLMFAVLVVFAFAIGGYAQVANGNLVGSILDASGASVPNAKVEIENVATGVKSTTTTDATGSYRFNNLLVGTYNITASATGFATAGLKQVAIELNKTTTANVTLPVGGVSQEVSVVEATAL